MDFLERIRQGKFVLIGEIGVNYYDIAKKEGITPMQAAKRMVKEAKDAGMHAVKFQSYKAETLAAKQSPSYWDTTQETTTSQYALFKKFDAFSEKEYRELSAYCTEMGIAFFSTAFDYDSADYLEPLMDVYKISSSDLSNIPFIAYQAKKNKPIFLSVGASNQEEIEYAVQTIRKVNQQMLVLMHCVLEYPTPYADANLNKILSLKEKFPDVYIGYSDHTKPDLHYDVIKTAYNLGAHVVEKHYTLDKTLPGNDHYHAMDPQDAKNILQQIAFIETLRGSKELKCLETEALARKNARRSIVSAGPIARGTVVQEEMLTFKRPGIGIAPGEIKNLVGRKAKIDIADDTILQWDMFSGDEEKNS